MSELDALIKEISSRLEKKSEEFVKKSKIIKITDDNVDKVLKENKVVVIDFWAEWCSPCHLYEPIFEKVAEKYSDEATFGRLNVDENPKTADRYQVLNIPTTLIFVNGNLVDSLVGAVDEETLEGTLAKYLDRG
ncbi:MAG: thioredoxin [Candidatus Aramenus sulfurataquae]|uniref:Thioredoxin n=3 Tax=Candidatus Aramenus sulfurataquae TaxID=1326980 RepID=A0A0F2LR59_9CREN